MVYRLLVRVRTGVAIVRSFRCHYHLAPALRSTASAVLSVGSSSYEARGTCRSRSLKPAAFTSSREASYLSSSSWWNIDEEEGEKKRHHKGKKGG